MATDPEADATGRAQRLAHLLQAVDRPGDYQVHDKLVSPMPRIEVKGVGTLSYPLPAAQISDLVAAAERAPYGRGPKTILDRSVRDCWQIDAKSVRVGGAGWKDVFEGIMERVSQGLGCPADRLTARLYKLLVYEPGGFFASHRDTEKMDGMIGTLVIALPSPGKGGDLVICHKDREAVVDMRVDDPSELSFVAFYSDCRHETRPITEGNRVCLVYSLVLKTRRGDAPPPAGAPDHDARIDEIADLLADWGTDREEPRMIAWILEHDYSWDGLSFDALKNGDATVARILAQAAGRAGCELHAATVSVDESSDVEYDPYDGYQGFAEDSELLERYVTLEKWTAADGSVPAFPEVVAEDSEIIPADALADADPDEEWIEEEMGNGGATAGRAYRRTALVLWPAAGAARVLGGRGS